MRACLRTAFVERSLSCVTRPSLSLLAQHRRLPQPTPATAMGDHAVRRIVDPTPEDLAKGADMLQSAFAHHPTSAFVLFGRDDARRAWYTARVQHAVELVRTVNRRSLSGSTSSATGRAWRSGSLRRKIKQDDRRPRPRSVRSSWRRSARSSSGGAEASRYAGRGG